VDFKGILSILTPYNQAVFGYPVTQYYKILSWSRELRGLEARTHFSNIPAYRHSVRGVTPDLYPFYYLHY
jgi:hypothetical protein